MIKKLVILVLLATTLFLVSCGPNPEAEARARAIESAANQDAADRAAARAQRESATDYTPLLFIAFMAACVAVPIIGIFAYVVVHYIQNRPQVIERVVVREVPRIPRQSRARLSAPLPTQDYPITVYPTPVDEYIDESIYYQHDAGGSYQ